MKGHAFFLPLLLGFLLFLPDACSARAGRVQVTEKLEGRVRVLYVASGGPHRHYLQLNFLERSTDLRFIYQRDSSPRGRRGETAAAHDGILWDRGAVHEIAADRVARLNRILSDGRFEMIILDGKDLSPETGALLAEHVRGGGRLVWLGSTVVQEGPLAALCPFRPSDRAGDRDEQVAPVRPDHPLVKGLPVGEMFSVSRRTRGVFREEVELVAGSAPSGFGLLGVMPVGAGTVIALNSGHVIPPLHGSDLDSDRLWASFWERLGALAAARPKAAVFSLDVPEDVFDPGEKVSISFRPASPEAAEARRLVLELSDRSGQVHAREEFPLPRGPLPGATMEMTLPADMPGDRYLLSGRLGGRRDFLPGEAFAVLEARGPVTVTLATDRYGYEIGEPVLFRAQVSSRTDRALSAALVVSDAMNIPVFYREKPLEMTSGGEAGLAFEWRMPDFGVEGWAFCADIVLSDEAGRVLGSAKHWFWRYQPWTMREKFLFSSYWTWQRNTPAAMMPLLALYQRGIGFNAGHHWNEPYYSRFNKRAWYQHGATASERFTGNFRTPDFSHLAEWGERDFERFQHTAAHVIHDFGEETGFYRHWSNNPFARTWRRDEDIPEGAHRIFRLYLEEKYGDILSLNREWEQSFASFDDVFLRRRYGLPSGWLYGRPPAEVDDNLAPHIDTLGFFFWYVRQAAEGLTAGINRFNPTGDWSMSFTLTFNLFSPIPMTLVSPYYAAQVFPAWHERAVRNSRGGNTPLFSFHWGFDQDYRGWAQFWHHNLAALSTFQSNWGDMFNFNLTHSRSTLLFKRLMSRLRPREKFFLDCYPLEEYGVGIYHPMGDWAQVYSRPAFTLRAQGPEDPNMGQLGHKYTGAAFLGGPEHQVYNALAAAGHAPRFVSEEEITRCRVLFVPWVETLGAGAVSEMEKFVAAGGILVTMPVTGNYNEYGRPWPTVPGGGLAELAGLTLGREIVGQRSNLVLSAAAAHDRLDFSYTSRVGGEPPYLWSFGHQAVESLADGVKVLLRLYDGNPAMTVREHGRGLAVHLNMVTFDHFHQYEQSPFQNESLRQLLDNLARAGGLVPLVTMESPWRFGIGVNEWVHYHYRLKDSAVRVIAVHSDKNSPRVNGLAVISEPMAEVYDILAGKRVPLDFRVGGETVIDIDDFSFEEARRAGLTRGYTFPVHLEAGDLAFYALVPYRTGPIEVTAGETSFTVGEKPLSVTVTVRDADGRPVPGAHPVHLDVLGPDGRVMPMLSRRLTVPGEKSLVIPTRLGDPGGRWRLRVRDCLTGREDSVMIDVRGNPLAGRLPGRGDIFPGSALALGPIEVSDDEFIALLDSLRELYLSGGEDDNKADLSYYALELDASRNRIAQLLGEADWLERLPALTRHLRAGNTVILLGEDLGRDPESGLPLDPIRRGGTEESALDPAAAGDLRFLPDNNRLAALSRLTRRDVHREVIIEKRTIDMRIGRGRLVLEPVSFDNIAQARDFFRVSRIRWLEGLEKVRGAPRH